MLFNPHNNNFFGNLLTEICLQESEHIVSVQINEFSQTVHTPM